MRKLESRVTPYTMEFQPLILKQIALDCDVSQGELAKATGVSRTSMNLCFNKGYIPMTVPGFKSDTEEYLATNPRATQWLMERGLKISDIWNTGEGKELRHVMPAGNGDRMVQGKKAKRQGLATGLPDQIVMKWEVEMISEDTKRHFKLFRNPFVADVEKSGDIFRSDEHRYIEMAMLDAAKNGGFLAVVGEVGSGKTTMRREVMEQLRKETNVMVIFPQIIDKSRVTASSICDAIILDLSEEKPKVKLEQKTRQVQRLMMDRSRAGFQACLIIEEAHDLSTQTLKYLKRFSELEDGYKKLLGIILIGQTELKNMFNESQHVEMREVIRRVQVAEIRGLNGNLKDYLRLKFKRVGGDIDKIMDEAAIVALGNRLTMNDSRNKPVSHAYPLLVNNYVARAMNLACELGETVITEEVVNGI
ncbi:MAG TPA: type II secretory pathway, component ExeA [Candidatus Omnitrophica bacterium]|nr:type II secretory pathway, component ExeA [Candidatus Omnitrophota bacterium]